METLKRTPPQVEERRVDDPEAQASWIQAPVAQWDTEATTIQVVGSNPSRAKKIGEITQGDTIDPVFGDRQVVVVFAHEGNTDTILISPAGDVEADLTQVVEKPLTEVATQYVGEQIGRRTLKSVLSNGASCKRRKVDEGNKENKITKRAWTFGSSEIGKIVEKNTTPKVQEISEPVVDPLKDLPF